MLNVPEREPAFLDPVRTDISARIRRLQRELPSLSVREIAMRVDALRRLGRAHDLEPVRIVAAGLAEALARDGRGAIIPTYLQSLSEALFCESGRPEAGEALLAAVNVRFSA